MTHDDRFMSLLTDWLEDQPDAAPDQLLDAVMTDLRTAPQRAAWATTLRRLPMLGSNVMRYAVAAGGVALAVVISVTLWSGQAAPTTGPADPSPTQAPTSGPTAPPPTESPSPPPPPTPTPAVTQLPTDGRVPTPTLVAGLLHGWPSTRENPPGLYSWTGTGGNSTHLEGFMHNGYGSGDVQITVEVVPETTNSDDGAQAVIVAGHDGIYRRIDAQREEWIVVIDGTTIQIRLEARPGTSQADLDEAHAIIGSMRYEPRASEPFGFRLVFTIRTGDWDSG